MSMYTCMHAHIEGKIYAKLHATTKGIAVLNKYELLHMSVSPLQMSS